ncbi:MAG: helix-turn-helix domain-containing protein [Pseudomonadota bacterium]
MTIVYLKAGLAEWRGRHISCNIRQTMTISILVLDGCQAGTVYGLLDAFAVARRVEETLFGHSKGALQVNTVGLNGSEARTNNGLKIALDGQIGSAALGDTLIVPGCMTDPEQLPDQIDSHDTAAGFLRREFAAGKSIVGLCSSVFLLGKAGLLDGREATTSWWAQALLVQRFPRAKLRENALLTVDDRVTCAAGPFAHYSLALHLIEQIRGPDVANLFAKFAMIDTTPAAQIQFRSSDLQRLNYPLPYSVEQLVRKALPTVPKVDEIAAELGLSVRTLQRKLSASGLTGAKDIINRVRMDRAKELLVSSKAPLTHIVADTGYIDVSAFRRAFIKHTGESPLAYRKKRLALN